MTDPTPSPFSDEELSASLDGEVTDEVRRAIEADPSAVARREELATAAGAVAAAPEPLSAPQVDDLIATALAEPIAPTAPVRPARSRTWLVAASIVVLLAVGLGLIWKGRTGTESATEFTTVGKSIGAESADDAAAGSGGASHGAGASSTVPPVASSIDAPVAALGTFASGAELRKAVAGDPDALRANPGDKGEGPSAAQLGRCAQQLQVALSIDADPTAYGYATVDGRPVLVYEFPHTSYETNKPTTLVAAVGQDACDEVVFFERG